jgi:hypothetical protein
MAANLLLGGSSMAAQTSGHQQRSSGRKGTRCLGEAGEVSSSTEGNRAWQSMAARAERDGGMG